MKNIIVPSITANEDSIKISKINIENNKFYDLKKIICILESSKTSFELELEYSGYVNFLFNEGAEILTGEIIAVVNESKLSPSEIDNLKLTKDEEKEDSKKIKITKKAELLIKKYGLKSEKIKNEGIITTEDVNLYYRDQISKNQKLDDVNHKSFEKVDEVLKKNYENEVDLKELESFKNLISSVRNTYAKKWKRKIPFFDILFDRWTNAKDFGFGDSSNISHNSYIFGDVKIGKNTFIGPFTILDGSAGLEIGNNTSIAAGVQIYSHDSIGRALSGHKVDQKFGKVKIGNKCFIGPNSVITQGVSIGDNCFIGANTVITFDVKSNSAVAGNPSKIIGRVSLNGNKILIQKNE
jgi:acetyltransferase-like isoleucine patch superfamily enzyme